MKFQLQDIYTNYADDDVKIAIFSERDFKRAISNLNNENPLADAGDNSAISNFDPKWMDVESIEFKQGKI